MTVSSDIENFDTETFDSETLGSETSGTETSGTETLGTENFASAINPDRSSADLATAISSTDQLPASPLSLWKKSLELLQPSLDPQIYSAYLKPLRFVGLDQGGADQGSSDQSNQEHTNREYGEKEYIVAGPSKFLCSYVERTYLPKLKALLIELGEPATTQIKLIVDPELAESLPAMPIVVTRTINSANSSQLNSSQSSSSQTNKFNSNSFNSNRSKPNSHISADDGTVLPDCNINPRYTFANFVVGSNSQFCHAAALRVAELPGKSYNPFFIYGGVGLGKTHILHAIGNYVLSRNPESKVAYLSSETFTNELIVSLRNGRMESFKARFRSIDLLLIDDIQFMAGKERTQEEFFHTFNALYNEKRQIIITSDKIPQEIPGIEERLHTRFSWGLTADLQAPDFETRVAILNGKAINEGFDLPVDVAHLVAEHVSSNVRELEGALTKLTAFSSLQKLPITIDLARNALRHLMEPRQVRINVDDIKRCVATHFGLKLNDLSGKRRTKNVSFPRHLAMYLCRKHTTCSYFEIGNHFGGRDHSSVIHAANVVSQKINSDPVKKGLVFEVERALLGIDVKN